MCKPINVKYIKGIYRAAVDQLTIGRLSYASTKSDDYKEYET